MGLTPFVWLAQTTAIRHPSLGLLVLASGLEIAQVFVPGRGAEWVTALVSGFGGVSGVVLAAGLLRTAGLQMTEAAGRGPAPRVRVHSP